MYKKSVLRHGITIQGTCCAVQSTRAGTEMKPPVVLLGQASRHWLTVTHETKDTLHTLLCTLIWRSTGADGPVVGQASVDSAG